MPNQLARIALILHALTTVRAASGGFKGRIEAGIPTLSTAVASRVPLSTLESAIALIDHFKEHTRRVYGQMYGQRRRSGNRRTRAAGATRTIRMRVIAALRTAERLSENELLREVLGGHVKAADLRAALEEEEADGTIVHEVVQGRGRPTIFWRLVDGEQQAVA
jgi:hypothetical protein